MSDKLIQASNADFVILRTPLTSPLLFPLVLSLWPLPPFIHYSFKLCHRSHGWRPLINNTLSMWPIRRVHHFCYRNVLHQARHQATGLLAAVSVILFSYLVILESGSIPVIWSFTFWTNWTPRKSVSDCPHFTMPWLSYYLTILMLISCSSGVLLLFTLFSVAPQKASNSTENDLQQSN